MKKERNHPRSARNGQLIASAIALIGSSTLLTNWLHAEPKAELGIEEFAEVYVDHYVPPHPNQLLDERGKRKSEALARYYLGLSRQKAGDIEGALDAYEEVLNFTPGQMGLAAQTAELAGQFNEIARGKAILQRSFDRNKNLPAAYLKYADFLWTYHDNKKNSRDEALAIITEATKKFPNTAEPYVQLIRRYQNLKDQKKAKEILAKALSQPSKDPEFFLKFADSARNLHPQKGEEVPGIVNGIFEKALELGSGNPKVETIVAQFFTFTKQFEKARELLESVVKARPDDLPARQKLTGIYRHLGEDEKAVQAAIELEKINPNRLETQQFLAQTYTNQENWPKAIEHYLKSFRIEKGSSIQYQWVARMMMWEDRANEAVELLLRAQFHYPEDTPIMKLIGVAYNAGDHYKKAYDTFQKIEELAQGDAEIADGNFYFSFGAAAERLKLLPEAEKLFQKSIDLVPKANSLQAAMPYNYLGYMWLEQDKNIEEAGQLIIMANELIPDSSAYVDSLGWYYFKTGEFELALETLERAHTMMKENDEDPDPVIFDHIGQTHFKLKGYEAAISNLKEAIKLEPENEEYQKRLKEIEVAKENAPKESSGTELKKADPEEPLEESEGEKPTELPKEA